MEKSRRAAAAALALGVAVLGPACTTSAPRQFAGTAPTPALRLDVNDAGWVVACDAPDPANGGRRGWFARPGDTARQPLPGPVGSCPLAINDLGVAVGAVYDGDQPTPASWDLRQGTWRALGMPGGVPGAIAYDVNDAGVAVGAGLHTPTVGEPVRWDAAGTPTVLGGGPGAARAINDAGLAVGVADGATVSWEPNWSDPYRREWSYDTTTRHWSVNERGDIALGIVSAGATGTVVLAHDRPTEPTPLLTSLVAVHVADDGRLVGYAPGAAPKAAWYDASTDVLTTLDTVSSSVLAARAHRAVGVVHGPNQVPTVVAEWLC